MIGSPLGSVQKIHFKGGAGDDSLQHDYGASPVALPPILLDGGPGNDTLYCGRGNDVIRGREGNDRGFGFDGQDVLVGGADRDSLHGGTGEDFLCGDAGRDTMNGNQGTDWLFAGDAGDNNFDFDRADHAQVRGPCAMTPLVGDFNGDGADEVGAHVASHALFLLFDPARPFARFGNPGDVPFVGDWDGNNTDDPGVFRAAGGLTYYQLDEGPFGNNVGEAAYQFGLAGDWDGDRKDEFGALRWFW